MDSKDKKDERPFAYPQPSARDEQLNNQPEYVDQEPNRDTNEISDMPGPEKTEQENLQQDR